MPLILLLPLPEIASWALGVAAAAWSLRTHLEAGGIATADVYSEGRTSAIAVDLEDGPGVIALDDNDDSVLVGSNITARDVDRIGRAIERHNVSLAVRPPRGRPSSGRAPRGGSSPENASPSSNGGGPPRSGSGGGHVSQVVVLAAMRRWFPDAQRIGSYVVNGIERSVFRIELNGRAACVYADLSHFALEVYRGIEHIGEMTFTEDGSHLNTAKRAPSRGLPKAFRRLCR